MGTALPNDNFGLLRGSRGACLLEPRQLQTESEIKAMQTERSFLGQSSQCLPILGSEQLHASPQLPDLKNKQITKTQHHTCLPFSPLKERKNYWQ